MFGPRLKTTKGRIELACWALLALVGGACLDAKPDSARKRPLDGPTSKAKPQKFKNANGMKELYLAAQPRSKTEVGAFRVPSPYRLTGPFEMVMTVGLFNDKRAQPGAGLFGFELDGEATAPLEFAGLFARWFNEPAGMQVFVSSENGNHGDDFFPGATRVDLRAVSDGNNTDFFARPVGMGDYQLIGSVPRASGAPYNPSAGFFNVAPGAEIGFARFDIPSHTPAPAKTDLEDAQDTFYEGVRKVLNAAGAMDPMDMDMPAARAFLVEAQTLVDDAVAKTAALEHEQAAAAAKQMGKVSKEIAKSIKKLDKKGGKARLSIMNRYAKKIVPALVKVVNLLGP